MPGRVTPYELIKAKREGRDVAPAELKRFIDGYTRGDIPDYQMSSLLMAVFFRGLSAPELAGWTEAMLHSGDLLDLSEIPGRKVDKHSTGGVGDKVSLSLAPLAAACGVPVPMISGRGLGHTGGTLDKLESIPGFHTNLPVEDFRRLVRDVGACLIGQTERLAPADKKLYALRDVTATVDCIPLIASSIMSKKLAEGIDALVLDVKVGSGAFMKHLAEARLLALTMIAIGHRMGREVLALVTDMEQPLGTTVGNALEVIEAVELLKGRGAEDYTELTLALTAEMLIASGVAPSEEDARKRLKRAIADGSALVKFEEIVGAQGGDPRALHDYRLLPTARETRDVLAREDGYLIAVDTEAVGLAAVALGAGRERTDSRIDPSVGFTVLKRPGDSVRKGEPLLRIHHNGGPRVDEVEHRLLDAYRLGEVCLDRRPIVLDRLDARDLETSEGRA